MMSWLLILVLQGQISLQQAQDFYYSWVAPYSSQNDSICVPGQSVPDRKPKMGIPGQSVPDRTTPK